MSPTSPNKTSLDKTCFKSFGVISRYRATAAIAAGFLPIKSSGSVAISFFKPKYRFLILSSRSNSCIVVLFLIRSSTSTLLSFVIVAICLLSICKYLTEGAPFTILNVIVSVADI